MPSSSMPWVKLYTEMLNDPKLFILPDLAKLRFIQLILLAGECDAEGYLVSGDTPLSLQYIAHRLVVDIGKLQDEIDMLLDAGLIEMDDGAYCVVNFSKRQGRSQEEKRILWRERQQKSRANRDAQVTEPTPENNVTPVSLVTHAPVTLPEERRGEEEKRRKPPPPPKTGGGRANGRSFWKEDIRELAGVFASKRGCPIPSPGGKSEYAAVNKRWVSPLAHILALCDNDPRRAARLIEITIGHMSGRLTFSAPDQIVKTAESLAADLKSGNLKDPGLQLTEEERLAQAMADIEKNADITDYVR